MESFLLLNGAELQAGVDEQEQVMAALASGQMSRGALTEWLKEHIVPRSS
jgi:prophage maintenance system killer protein